MLDREPLIGTRACPALVPPVNGKPVTPRTVLNWMKAGVGGHVLESKLVGKRRCTSSAAIARFLKAVNEPIPAGVTA